MHQLEFFAPQRHHLPMKKIRFAALAAIACLGCAAIALLPDGLSGDASGSALRAGPNQKAERHFALWIRNADAAARLAEADAEKMRVLLAVIPGGAAWSEPAEANRLRKLYELSQTAPEFSQAGDSIRNILEGLERSGENGSEPNGSAQSLDFGPGKSACYLSVDAQGDSLEDALGAAFSEKAQAAALKTAKSRGIGADEIAFWISAHEAAHCITGAARRDGIFSSAALDAAAAPQSWAAAQSPDDPDSPAAARAEEVASDLYACSRSQSRFGFAKGRKICKLATAARKAGAEEDDDELHDSSGALDKMLASGAFGQSPAELWRLAEQDTLAKLGAAQGPLNGFALFAAGTRSGAFGRRVEQFPFPS